MAGLIDLSTNYSFYALPLAWLCVNAPGFYSKALGGTNYDIAYPRNFQENVKKDEKLDKAVSSILSFMICAAVSQTIIPNCTIPFNPSVVALMGYILQTSLPPLSLLSRTKSKILRAEAAAANGQETVGLFAAAVIAANYTGVPVETINTVCAVWLGTRVVYNTIYIFLQENRSFAPLRSLVWNAGLISWVTLCVKAGNRAVAASS
ncbi:hypothetical protein F5Y19DRAFT_476197 [Xylariaceae sp. FL1651]|nr:hypothetical protein F5Y19DRAFT_476197 [Xylariaceae sp. FL1651]